MMKKGFVSFILCTVFLLALLVSAENFSKAVPDNSYQKFQSLHIGQIAIKQAFYSSLSQTVSLALKTAPKDKASQSAATAAYLQALDFEGKLQEHGYSILFWCSSTSEATLQQASLRMSQTKSPQIPQGAFALSNPVCTGSFEVNVLERKIHISEVGFSLYSDSFGIGYSTAFPQAHEVEF